MKKLRLEERYSGYIHLKTIPGASEDLISEAGLYVDRMSINLEMPADAGLKLVAPEKNHESVKKPLHFVNQQIKNYQADKKLIKSVPTFVPAGQSTQMVIGATPESDFEIMSVADNFYKNYNLKRVYYSGYIPINDNHTTLPQIGTKPPLIRENRLYQTDWLLRFYDFELHETLNDNHTNLELAIDPKLSWALRNPQFFPVDINKASYREIILVIFKSGPNYLNNFGDEKVLYYHKAIKKVSRERHRMQAFIRFQQSSDGLFFAIIDPDFQCATIIA